MWRATVIALVFLLSSSFPPTPFAWSLELAATGWRQNPSGNLAFSDGNSSDDLDLREDLDYGVRNRVGGRLKVGLPFFLPNLYFAAMPSRFDGTGRKETDFRFGNRSFEGNVDFHSDLKLDQYDVVLFYGLPFLKTATRGTLGAEIGVNLRVMDFDMTVSQAAVFPVGERQGAGPHALSGFAASACGLARDRIGRERADLQGGSRIHPPRKSEYPPFRTGFRDRRIPIRFHRFGRNRHRRGLQPLWTLFGDRSPFLIVDNPLSNPDSPQFGCCFPPQSPIPFDTGIPPNAIVG
jgi:hypothetical protein